MKPRTIVLLLAFLALAAKLYCAATTCGTNDAVTFLSFGHRIDRSGLIVMYRETIIFNHTPLVGWFTAAIFDLAQNDLDSYAFNFFLRAPAIFADLFCLLALMWTKEKTGKPSWCVLGLLAVSPVSFMISGFHANVDSVMVLGLVLAGLACVFNRPVLSGLCFALSCNIKIVPLFLAPAFFFYWLQHRKALRFALPAAGATLLGWSYPLIVIPQIFFKNVVAYSSVWGLWGFGYLLRMCGAPDFQRVVFTDKTWPETVATRILQVFIIAGVLLLAWKRRKTEGFGIFKTLALSWAVFFVFSPGFGGQYLIWLAPFFLVADELWYAALTLSSSVALFIFYTAGCDGQIPWDRAFHVQEAQRVWGPWMFAIWLILAAYLVRAARIRSLANAPEEAVVPAVAEGVSVT
ncbi:MAG TPA: glycosyltransferase 87 family protein [Chthoniobacteraceae bacterium]